MMQQRCNCYKGYEADANCPVCKGSGHTIVEPSPFDRIQIGYLARRLFDYDFAKSEKSDVSEIIKNAYYAQQELLYCNRAAYILAVMSDWYGYNAVAKNTEQFHLPVDGIFDWREFSNYPLNYDY